MSRANSPFYFRRRIGRATSPPTWAWYEQIPYDDDCSDSNSESCSEDEDDYSGLPEEREYSSDREGRGVATDKSSVDDLDMDVDGEGDVEVNMKTTDAQKDVKGKQRAVDPQPLQVKKAPERKKRPPVYSLRPILTIQKSQGFVWNQDLFVPPYIKDRYVVSTSPPNSKNFLASSQSSTNSGMIDYEVEVVEIRVNEGDLDHIMP